MDTYSDADIETNFSSAKQQEKLRKYLEEKSFRGGMGLLATSAAVGAAGQAGAAGVKKMADDAAGAKVPAPGGRTLEERIDEERADIQVGKGYRGPQEDMPPRMARGPAKRGANDTLIPGADDTWAPNNGGDTGPMPGRPDPNKTGPTEVLPDYFGRDKRVEAEIEATDADLQWPPPSNAALAAPDSDEIARAMDRIRVENEADILKRWGGKDIDEAMANLNASNEADILERWGDTVVPPEPRPPSVGKEVAPEVEALLSNVGAAKHALNVPLDKLTPKQLKLFSAIPAPILASIAPEDRVAFLAGLEDVSDLGGIADVLGAGSKMVQGAISPAVDTVMKYWDMLPDGVKKGIEATLAVGTAAGVGLPAIAAAVPLEFADHITQDPFVAGIEKNAASAGRSLRLSDLSKQARAELRGKPQLAKFWFDNGVIEADVFNEVFGRQPAQKIEPQVETQRAVKTEGFKGHGGYGYELMADGNVRIVDAPEGFEAWKDKVYKTGSGPHTAIMNEYKDRFPKRAEKPGQ